MCEEQQSKCSHPFWLKGPFSVSVYKSAAEDRLMPQKAPEQPLSFEMFGQLLCVRCGSHENLPLSASLLTSAKTKARPCPQISLHAKNAPRGPSQTRIFLLVICRRAADWAPSFSLSLSLSLFSVPRFSL